MKTRTEIKTDAKKALEGKWGKGALIVLCYVIIEIVIGLIAKIPIIGPIASVVVNMPMALGIIYSFIKLKRGEEVGAFEFLELGFSNFSKAWAIFGRTLLKMIVPVILMIIAWAVIIGCSVVLFINVNTAFYKGMGRGSISGDIYSNSFKGSYNFNYGGYDYDFSDISYITNPYTSDDYGIDLHINSDVGEELTSTVGSSIGLIVVIVIDGLVMFAVSIWSTCKGLLYALAQFIAYDNPNMSAKDIVQKSEDMMRGNRGKLFILQLSFFGWMILASITLGIGYFWLLPYMIISLIVFYEDLAGINSGNLYTVNSQNVNVVNNPNMNNQYNPIQQNTYQPQNTTNVMSQDIYQPQNKNNPVQQNSYTYESQNANNTAQQNSYTYEPQNTNNTAQQNSYTYEPQNTSNVVQPDMNRTQETTDYGTFNQTPNTNQYNPTNDTNQINPMNNDFNNPNNNM